MDEKKILDDCRRLAAVYPVDAGYFCVAAHAFIESVLSSRVPEMEKDAFSGGRTGYPEFREKIEAYQHWLRVHHDAIGLAHNELPGYFRLLDDFGKNHKYTNQVRHGHARLDAHVAAAFLSRLRLLADFEKLPGPARESLAACLVLTTYDEMAREMARMERESAGLKLMVHDHERAVLRLGQLEDAARERDRLQATVLELEQRLEAAEAEAASGNAAGNSAKERVRDLRGERAELKARCQALEHSLAKGRRREETMQGFLWHSKSRAELERRLMALNAAQLEAVAAFNGQRFFLVKGPAGSGKSMVLLKCVERALELAAQGQLFDATGVKPLVMSYARLTTGYIRFQARVLDLFSEERVDAMTIDRWMGIIFRKLFAREVEYPDSKGDVLGERLARCSLPAGFDLAGLRRELGMIWSRDVRTLDGYLALARTGMGSALGEGPRRAVWALAEEVAADLMEHEAVPFQLAWYRLAAAVDAGRGADHVRPWIFVDECQDLPLTQLKILAGLSLHLVLAGDSEQMIYSGTSPYAAAGIDLRAHKPRVLKTVFRNSLPIHRLAGLMRGQLPGADADYAGEANRPGPLPELVVEASWREIRHELVVRIRELCLRDESPFSPGSVAILVPRVEKWMTEMLNENGIPFRVLKDEDPVFDDVEHVNICTMHSSKGMDFPAVIVWLSDYAGFADYLRVHDRADADSDAFDARLARLLYVAVTRAMDWLGIFIRPDDGLPFRPEVAALVAAHRAMIDEMQDLVPE